MSEQREASNSGVLAGTHTAPAGEQAAAAGRDLFGGSTAPDLIEGKPAGSRAGRPNKLNRIMAAKVEAEHGTSVLQELVRMGMTSEADLVREAIAYAKATAEALGKPDDWREFTGALTFSALRRLRADMLATAAPYLHAKRAPEDGKGRAQPVVIAFAGLEAADLRRTDAVLTDDNLTIDLVAEAMGQVEQNQGVSDVEDDATGRIADDDDENASDNRSIYQ